MKIKPRIAIVSALAQEQSGLVQSLEQAQEMQHAGRRFDVGLLYGQPVVLVLSGIGKVAAATTATALIEHFGVQVLVFTGVAGGVGAGVRVGDVVVASGYVQHDMDASPIFPRWQVPGYADVQMPCDGLWTAQLHAAAQACLQGEDAGVYQHADGQPNRVHLGLIASGDQFVSNADVSAQLCEELTSAGHAVLAVEMEGAAVAQVCLDYGVAFAAVRTISDRADDAAHEDFPRFIQTVASRYADHIVHALLMQ